MLSRLLSHDFPRSRILAAVLIVLLLGLALTPFIFPGVKALSVAAKILVFVVLVVGGLTFLPALALGPLVEQIDMLAGRVF